MYTKHGLNRMMERVLLNQNRKFNKRQRERIKSKAQSKYSKDFNKKIAVSMDSHGIKYYYVDLRDDNTCLKYVVTPENKVITVYETNLLDEQKKYHLNFTQNYYLNKYYYKVN